MEQECPQMLTRATIPVEVRGIDEAKRYAEFVAATENGVETWNGREYLKLSGMSLARYRKNPVVLDTHDRSTIQAVVGVSATKVESRELLSGVTFADTDRANDAWKLVKGKFVRSMSVGFMVIEVQMVQEGKTVKLGDQEVVGPARIVTKSMLYEVSICPVGADEDALRRSLLGLPDGVRFSISGDRPMSKSQEQESAPTAPAETEEKKAPQETETRAAPVVVDVKATDNEIRSRDIMALAHTPELRSVAQRCILEGKSVDEARRAMLEDYARRSTPAGTTEPKPVETREEAKGPKLADVSDDVLLRSLCG